ncbi:hypothetical protein [Psychroserpens sp. NJDZ02]|uniref:hypothetical protein n=1 Tax=Psychroserpens sp. NJDZ02 TaxID=2570561 RepID=UPI0010A8843C|nr:hypothetical protein [Psychroserpens sp. NJDZ02]QCE40221.1 hypothetical protein E9099_01880 [Psychroserpens sp. NJDZ02]
MKLSNIVLASLIASSVSGCMENNKSQTEQPIAHQDSIKHIVVTPKDSVTTKPKTEPVMVLKDSITRPSIRPNGDKPIKRLGKCPACGMG